MAPKSKKRHKRSLSSKREPPADREVSVASDASVGKLKSDLGAKASPSTSKEPDHVATPSDTTLANHNDHTSNHTVENVTHPISVMNIGATVEMTSDAELRKVVDNVLVQIGKLTDLSKVSAAKNLRIVAGEVLRWSLAKGKPISERSSIFHNKRKFYTDRIKACKEAFGFKTEDEVKKFGNECINVRNDTAHFNSLKALDCGVKECAMALLYFPCLRDDGALENQILVIDNYDKLKTTLNKYKLHLSINPNETSIKSSTQERSKRTYNSMSTTNNTTTSYMEVVARN